MIYLCHLLVFILPEGCCQHQGPLFTLWQLHLKRKDSPSKNSASKQIRPTPLRGRGCNQDPCSVHVSPVMQGYAWTCIYSVHIWLHCGLHHLSGSSPAWPADTDCKTGIDVHPLKFARVLFFPLKLGLKTLLKWRDSNTVHTLCRKRFRSPSPTEQKLKSCVKILHYRHHLVYLPLP